MQSSGPPGRPVRGARRAFGAQLRRTLLLSGTALASGCAFVEAVFVPLESGSTSSTVIGGSLDGISLSASSLPSSSPAERENQQSYMRDLRQYVARFVASTGAQPSFRRGISTIAEAHGFSHWEGLPATSYAIGQGFAEAGMGIDEVQSLSQRLSTTEASTALMLAGWRASVPSPP